MAVDASPFSLEHAAPLARGKFRDPYRTNGGDERAFVDLDALSTLWFNTGTLCNLACKSCYIESSPKNDALAYITLAEVTAYLDEIAAHDMPTREIGLTGGEPFMNPDIIAIIQACLDRGFEVLVLSNAMRPMRRFEQELTQLRGRERLTIRVSLDHYTKPIHEQERGISWDKAVNGLVWLAQSGFRIAVAGRYLEHEDDAQARAGFARLFAQLDLPIDTDDAAQMVLFPAMDDTADIAEITTACWDILSIDPKTIMCASSRMVVKRKGDPSPRVAACTLLPYAKDFDLGATLVEAQARVQLNHPHCARFCVLGGASCSA